MLEVSKLKIGDSLYDIKDQSSREHNSSTDNPHLTTKAQVGLSKVENLAPSEILSKMDDGDVIHALGYVPVSKQDMSEILRVSERTQAVAETASTNVSNKIDKDIDSVATAIVNFVNGVQIAGATIDYDSVSDTITFS